MKPVPQLIDSPENGDCFRACVASLLEVDPLTLPNVAAPEHRSRYSIDVMNEAAPLRDRGLALLQRAGGEAFFEIPWMIWTVPSPRYEGEGHAVVVQHLYPQRDETAIFGHWRIAWDPSPWRDTDLEHRRECYAKPFGATVFVAREPWKVRA